jgi:chemotaxis protein methyltransferase CheR
VNDSECVEFLQWALPRTYRSHLEGHADEWAVLDELARITISRFNRDRGVFAALQADVLPALATAAVDRGSGTLEAWSAGCASGEEAYTLAIIWELELAPRSRRYRLRDAFKEPVDSPAA